MLKNSNQIKTAENILIYFKNYTVILTVTMGLVVTASFSSFWLVEEILFPHISETLSKALSLTFALILFLIGSKLVSLIFLRNYFNENSIDQWMTQEMEIAIKKIAILEQAITELKSNPNMSHGPSNTPARETDHSKDGIIMHERAFLHDIANKIQIVHTVVSMLQERERAKTDADEKTLKQLAIASNNLEKMTVLLKENRDFLIVST